MSVTTRGNTNNESNSVDNEKATEKAHSPTLDERSYIEALLDCSDRSEDFADTIYCDDWAEAAVGWKATVPNPKFVILNPVPVKRRRDDDEDRLKRSPYYSNFSNLQRKKNGATATYRYTTRNKTQSTGTRPLKAVNEGTVTKKPTDPGLQEHINKVKEHLELAFKNREQTDSQIGSQKLNEKFVADFLGNLLRSQDANGKSVNAVETKQPLQPSHASNAADGMDGVVLHGSTTESSGSGRKDESVSQGKENRKENKQIADYRLHRKHDDSGKTTATVSGSGDVTLVVENTRVRAIQQLYSKHEAGMKKEKEMDLLDKINKRLDESLAENDQYAVRLKKKSAYSVESGKVNSKSYEKFPAFTIVPADQGLKPLRKLTPSQRKAMDDNDVLTKMMKSDSEVDLREHVVSAPSVIAASEGNTSSSLSCTSEIVDKYRNETPSPNRNFMTKGINGKAISRRSSLIKDSPYAQPLFPEKERKKVNVRPRKVGSISSPNNSEGITPRPLGESVSPRPIQERNTSTIATELLPGIDGRKMTVPLMTQRLL